MARYGELLEAKIYVGGLPKDATEWEVEEAFRKYGEITKVFVAKKPPGFAFIEFEDPKDARSAVRALNGTRICGVRVRVELSHGRSKPKDFFENKKISIKKFRRSRSSSASNSKSRDRSSRDRDRSPRGRKSRSSSSEG